MTSLTRRRARLLVASALACAGLVYAGTSLAGSAAKKKETVHITVAPKAGKYGTKYNVSVKAKASTTGEELALAMTTTPASCPADYAAGFASLAGLANAKGKPIAPKYVHGNVKENVHAKITISSPGTYGICAYLTVGSVTKAHAASHFTIGQ
jgi:hypothetical protein